MVSRDRSRAQAFADEHDVPRAYDDLSAALHDPDVNCVWVATPHALHLEPVLTAAAAGKHVLCEKPLATSRADAREMLRACRRAGVVLATGFHLRSHPLHREMRRLVREGGIGPITFAEAEWSTPVRKPGEGYSSAWRSDPALAFAGITTGTGIHALDLLRFVLDDEIVEVSAATDAAESPIAPLESRAVVLLRFRRGTLATMRCLRATPQPANDLLLVGTSGRLLSSHSIDEVARGYLDGIGVEPQISGLPAGSDLYALEADDFVRACQEGSEPAASGEDGVRMVEVLDAVLESARTGRRIDLS